MINRPVAAGSDCRSGIGDTIINDLCKQLGNAVWSAMHPGIIVAAMLDIASENGLAGQNRPGRESEFRSHDVIEGNLDHGVILVCDHARNDLPPEYGSLGLPASEFERHIAYDIGVEAIPGHWPNGWTCRPC